MSKLVNRRLVFAKIEAVAGVAETLAGTDALLVENLQMSYVNERMAERPAVRVSFGKLPAIYAGSLVQLTFDVEIKASGTAGTAPEAGVLLQIAGMSETVVATTSVTYALISQALKTATIQYEYDGVIQTLTGCICSMTTAVNAGAIAKDSFTIIGHHTTPVDGAGLTPTYDAEKPAAVLSLGLTVNGVTLDAASLTFDLGNDITPIDSLNASDGYGLLEVTDRNVVGTIDPLATTVAVHDFISLWQASTGMAVTMNTIGSGAGSIVQINVPDLQYMSVQGGDRNNRITQQIDFKLNETVAGNDEIERVYT